MRKMILAACTGAAMAGAVTGALHGEEPVKKAYLVAEISVTDPRAYAEYAARVPATIAPWGGRYLARGGAIMKLEGTAPAGRIAVIEFPSLDAAKGFWNSPAYQTIAPLRHKASQTRAYIVEGTGG